MAYDMSLKKKWDEYSIKETAFNDGKQEGIEVGKREGIEVGKREGIEVGKREGIKTGRLEEKLVIARELLKIGLPIKQIAASTGLSEEKIEELSRNSSDRSGNSQ